MNTLQLIKARTTRTRAIQRARLQMAKAFGSADHIDAPHTPVGVGQKPQLRYRGVAYDPIHQDQEATGGRELRYRGVSYGVY